ncbi:MAG: AsnC family transcriptional regulator [Pseudomonadota bacterium]
MFEHVMHAEGSKDASTGRPTLDAKDLELIQLLRDAPRSQNRTLAKQLGVSAPTLLSRLRRLTQSGACELRLQRDFKQMGYAHLVSVEIDVSDRAQEDVAADLAQIPEVLAILGFLEGPTLSMQMIVRSPAHLRDIIKDQLADIAGIQRVRSNLSLKIHRYSNVFSEPGFGSYPSLSNDALENDFDAFDEEVLELLRTNGKLSNREVAKQLGTNEHKVRRRLTNLLDGKAAIFNYLVSPVAVGAGVWAYLRVAAEPAKQDSVLKTLLQSENCVSICETAGEWGFLGWVVFQDVDELRDFAEKLKAKSIAVSARVVDRVFKHNCDYARVL